MEDLLIETWRQIIVREQTSWVLFEHGTCIVLTNPEADLQEQAIALIKGWGPVHAGTPTGDFSVIKLSQHPGWVVTYYHPDILTYVSPDEVEPGASDVVIGLLGRAKRHQDSEELNIIHIEDKRGGS